MKSTFSDYLVTMIWLVDTRLQLGVMKRHISDEKVSVSASCYSGLYFVLLLMKEHPALIVSHVLVVLACTSGVVIRFVYGLRSCANTRKCLTLTITVQA